jgi:hypothetical protein
MQVATSPTKYRRNFRDEIRRRRGRDFAPM